MAYLSTGMYSGPGGTVILGGAIPPLKKKGELRKHGYSLKKKATERRMALVSASMVRGMFSTDKFLANMRRLNAIRNLTKNTQPANSKKYGLDINWMKKVYARM